MIVCLVCNIKGHTVKYYPEERQIFQRKTTKNLLNQLNHNRGKDENLNKDPFIYIGTEKVHTIFDTGPRDNYV